MRSRGRFARPRPAPPGWPRGAYAATALRLVASMLAALSVALSAARAEVAAVDDAGERIVLAAPARRIVSLAPHTTELLFAAGAGAALVGTVQYSDHPPEATRVPRIGGYSALDLEAIVAAKPDLVVGWQSGNPPEQVRRLRALGLKVFLSQPRALADLPATIERLGALAGTGAEAARAAGAFRARHAALRERYGRRDEVTVFYAIWNRPLMTVNDAHLISDVIRLCGGRNVFGTSSVLAPTVGAEDVLRADPEAIVASGMGEARPDWLDDWQRWPRLRAVQRGNLFFVPPDVIQRASPRVLDGAERLCAALEIARERRARAN